MMIQKKTIAVTGMMCAGCAANVERRLNGLEGIRSASVNLAGRTVLVEYDTDAVTLEAMKEHVASIGYDMIIEEDRSAEAIEQKAYRMLTIKTLWSFLFSVMVMSLSMGWIGASWSADIRNQTALIIALANLLWCGRQFYTNAWRQLTHGSANMDTLVALSTAVSFLFSTFNTFWGEPFWGSRGIEWHTYFDASVMIVTFVLAGRLLEDRAKRSTASSIRALMKLTPKTARLVDCDAIRDIPVTAVQPADIIEVRQGDKIPVDGSVSSCCAAFVDESMMTGESASVQKNVGNKVLAGTIVCSGTLRFRAEEVGQKTVLANMIRMVQEAQGSKAPVQRVVDRIARFFVPTVVALSLLTLVIWLIAGGSAMLPQAILSAVSVLVIACPCAMGLATPTALMVGIGQAARNNILIKDATALEDLRRIDALVTDKTGTLTEVVDNEERLKPHAREAVSMLENEGVKVLMMSGDTEERVRLWAREAGISHYRARVLPQDKENLVRNLQAQGHRVAMAGDGVNDSQALAAADVSIAMAQGTDVAINTAQVTLVGNDLRRITQAIRLSRRTVGMIHQNLFWAFVYNVVCIPLAAGLPWVFGLHWQITPMWASALMALSSVSVVLNSLRLRFSGWA